MTDPRRPLAVSAALAFAASLAVGGCAKHSHDGHHHDKDGPHDVGGGGKVAHVHSADGSVLYLDRPAQAATLGQAAAAMASAAQAFSAALDDAQRQQAQFRLPDEERLNWHFVPKERKGLPLKSMTPPQRDAAQALLKSGLSARGYVTATAITQLETILAEMEKDPVRRDAEKYFVSIFGKPEASGTWGWRFEGHHLSLNFTLVNGHAISASPAFMGTNPGDVREGPQKGLRVLGEAEDMGRALVKTLSDDQRKKGILPGDAPKDILTAANRKADIGAATGIAYNDLTPEQQTALMALIGHYAHRVREEVAENELARIKEAGLDKVHFAWIGSLDRGQPHYYRIQGPTFLIEYDNTQNNANHAHTVWRDLTGNDFGEDALRRHYELHKGDKAHGHDAK